MIYVPLESMLDKTEHSIYKLVILAARRALEIADGQPVLVDVIKGIKPSTIALLEIAAGKVAFKKVKEQ